MVDAFPNFAIDLSNLLLLNMFLNILLWQQFSLHFLRFAVVSIIATTAEVKEIGKPTIYDRCSKVFRHQRGNQRACARSGISYIILNGSWTPWHF